MVVSALWLYLSLCTVINFLNRLCYKNYIEVRKLLGDFSKIAGQERSQEVTRRTEEEEL